MDKNNFTEIKGDNNVSLTDVQAGRDIIIQINDSLPKEVKDEKLKLSSKLKHIGIELAALGKIIESEIISQQQNFCENCEIDWNELIEGIEFEDCVLVIGQEISSDSEGNSLHEKIFSEVGEKINIKFIQNEGFFEPAKDGEIRRLSNKISKYYRQEFDKLNKKAYKILEKLAYIPFSMIISVTPDNTMHKIYEKYNIKHQFIRNNGDEKLQEDPSAENPVIFNVVGDIEKRDYIYTHEHFYNYLKTTIIPPTIKEKITDSTHFLFLGFDFNKWYNRLLLFILNLDNKNENKYRHLIQEKETKEEFRNILKKQFSISFIDTKYNIIVDTLLHKIKDKKDIKIRYLQETFITNSFNKLMQLKRDFVDTDKLNKLAEVETELDILLEKITNFKKIV